MRKLCIAIVVLGVVLPTVVTLFSQSNDIGGITIPPELRDTPLKDWQLNSVTVLIIVQVLGRVWSALKTGGGLVGIWRGIVFGENVPKEVAQAVQLNKPPL